MIFSNFLFAVSVTGFIRPHGIILGGATGLGLLITHYIPMKLSVVVMIINVVLLLIAFVTMGKKFALSTLANSILYPSVMYIFETFIDLGKVTEDPMLSCVFGGVLMGIGIGLILKTGSSTGGTDVIAVAINKYTHVNLSVLLYIYPSQRHSLFLSIRAFSSSIFIIFQLTPLLFCVYFLLYPKNL